MGWGGSIILVRHNLSIIPPVKHNFKHNTRYPSFTGDARKHNTLFFEHNPADPRTDSLKTDIDLFFTITNSRIACSGSLTRRMNFKFICLSAY